MNKATIALCLSVACLGTFALGAESIPKAKNLKVGTDLRFDIAGIGTDQTIRLQYVGPADEAVLQLVIFGSDDGVNLYTTELSTPDTACITDLNGDGQYEILLSGSVAASDYLTYCLHFSDEEGIRAVPFADIDRGSKREGYTDTGYGLLSLSGSGRLALSGLQDILGTYVGTRVFELNDGRVELCDDGLWRFAVDDDTWDTAALTLKLPLSVTLSDGTPATLEAGESFIVTASDLTSVVYFRTGDGREGSFAVEPDTANGFGSLIAGVSENEYFEYIPYGA